MSRESIEDDRQSIFDEIKERELKKVLPEEEMLTSEDRIPVSDRPKILITTPCPQRFIRSQPSHYYHQHKQQYANIDEDWESCVDIPTRTTTSISMSTNTAILPSVSRASSHTSKSIASNPYR